MAVNVMELSKSPAETTYIKEMQEVSIPNSALCK